MLLQRAAEAGAAQQQFELGHCYEKGILVEKDLPKAAIWYRKAAEHGHADAQDELGGCYWNGAGVERDQRRGIEWIANAAALKQAKAVGILPRMKEKLAR